MIKVVCPRCANAHLSDEVHEGKFLRCAKCGDAVQIGSKPENQIEAFESAADIPAKPRTQTLSLKFRRKISQNSRLAWVTIIIVAAAISSLFYFRPRNTDVFDEVSAPKKPTQLSTGDPFAAISSVATPPSPLSNHSTGDVVTFESKPRGRGKLSLINGTGEDSVVLMVNSETGDIARSVYVAAGMTGTIDRIAIGKYSIRATLGSGWSDADRTFTEDASYFRFPHPYKFSEYEIGDEVQSDRLSLTLHPVPNGNIHKEPISKAQFWASAATEK